MKKKLALIIISVDECFTVEGFSGGGHKVTKNLILGLVKSNLFVIDIFCKKSSKTNIDGINSITVLENKKTFVSDLEKKTQGQNYDYILSSDVLLPFGNIVLHSNSAKYKSQNCKNKFLQQILKIYNSNKIRKQEKCFNDNDKAVFTVSESLKKDYVQNYNLDESKVFVSYPAIDYCIDYVEQPLKNDFIIGSIAGGGLNKGGYLLLLALRKLPKTSRLKAKIIFPKFYKSFFFKSAIKLFELENRIELLPKQADMQAYYNFIDCYVLPSLNEAFGLVVIESASNFKPSLVSSTAGARELIVDGDNGFVFDRKKNPLINLTKKLVEITELYFNDNQKFTEISKNANKIAKKYDWQNFTQIIIKNMIGENKI